MAHNDKLEIIKGLIDKLAAKVKSFGPTQKCFLLFLEQIEDLVSSCQTMAQVRHYIDQFYTWTACMHEEIEVLIGGMLKRKHQTNIHRSMIHETERGSFDGEKIVGACFHARS